MPLPLIAVVALALAASGGVAAGVDGVHEMNKANARVKRAQGRHRDEVARLEKRRAETQRRVEAYGGRQLRVQRDTLGMFADWLERNHNKVKRLDRAVVDGIEVSVPDLPSMKFEVAEASDLLSGGLSAALAAIAARQAALTGVRALATAGTGAAISGLHGVAAESATLAWLGGGTLASGGGGMAAGATVLSGVAIAPALLLGGITLSVQGEKAKTEARKIEAQINLSIERMHETGSALAAIAKRVQELDRVLSSLNTRALASLAELQIVDFNPREHGRLFVRTAQLMRAIGEVLSAKVLDDRGRLTDESVEIIERYKEK